MENKENQVYNVLISHTTPLFNLIKELGFKEEKPEGHGLREIRKFKRGSKYIYSTHYYVELFRVLEPSKTKETYHKSLTIHDEELKFFANRNPIKMENGTKS